MNFTHRNERDQLFTWPLFVAKNDVQNSLKKYNFEHTTVEFEFADEQCRDEA